MSLKDRLSIPSEPLYLIDGSSFLYRAFYAYPDLKRSDGFPTNALFIVLRLLLKLKREEKPRYLVFFLDGKGKTFRHDIFEPYKAQRPSMPENLSPQIPPLLEGIELLGIKAEVADRAEADDYIASLARQFKNERPVIIVGSDKDLMQCLDERVVLWDPGQRNEKIVTLGDFKKQTGLEPGQWPDYQALVGDSSDNIPGVPGVGPKTARKLLKKFPSLEALKENFDRLTAKEQEKIGPHLDDIFTYRKLTRLRTDFFPMEGISTFACEDADLEGLKDFLERYEFKSLLRELDLKGASRADMDADRDVESVRSGSELRLASLKGKAVGLVPSKGGALYLGVDREEHLGTWPLEELVAALAGCKTIYLPDLKELMHRDPVWRELPVDRCFDIGLAAYLLSPEDRSYDWPKIFHAHISETELHSENHGLGALEVGRILEKRTEDAGLAGLMSEVEMPLIPVLEHMERRGVAIDRAAFAAFLDDVEKELERLSETIFERAGETFNLRSSQQLAEVLFSRLGLRPGRKTPGGAPSTASPVLEGLRQQHPVIDDILRFRVLEKLRSTYLDPMPKMVGSDGRLHTTFNQLATATGRLSSSNPNLQNIPIRGEFGPRMRACFVAGAGHHIVAADYSQIELRILAHMSQDPTLVAAFAKGEDIHSRTAALLFGREPHDILPDERRKAKTINFGLLYGMGPQKLAADLGITLKEAKSFIELYFSRLAKVREFYETVEAGARENGFVTTIAGRRRLLEHINSRNPNLAQQARRMAINAVVQGSAADIIKIAMIKTHGDSELARLKASLILQVHDELLLEVPKTAAREAGRRLEKIMSSVYTLRVPLLVDWGVGENWAQAH